MLKPFGFALLLAAMVFFAAVLGAATMLLSEHQSNEQITNQSEADKTSDKTAEDKESITSWQRIWRRTWDDPVALFTAALAVFSGGLLIVAFLQIWLLTRAENVSRTAANAAKSAADTAREALIKSQRAFVQVGGYPWLWRPDFSRPGKYLYDITPNFSNGGATPTEAANVVVNLALRDSPLPDNFNFPFVVFPVPTIIGPHQTIGAQGPVSLMMTCLPFNKAGSFSTYGARSLTGTFSTERQSIQPNFARNWSISWAIRLIPVIPMPPKEPL